MDIEGRKKRILSIIIEEYIRKGEPIGSKYIASKSDLGVSPATIRNAMADLEQMGYLVQPHTSAGRVPSDKGYRFYVDHLLNHYSFSGAEAERIHELLKMRVRTLDKFIEALAGVVSEFTNYTAVLVAPKIVGTIKHIELVPLDDTSFLFVMASSFGVVKNDIYHLPEPVNPKSIKVLSNALKKHFLGLPVGEIELEMLPKLVKSAMSDEGEIMAVLSTINELFDSSEASDVYLAGRANLFEFMEEYNNRKAKEFFSLLDNKMKVSQMLRPKSEKVEVIIGNENPVPQMHEISVVMRNYKIDGEKKGTLAVIGPTRMNYSKVITGLDYFIKFLDHLFDNNEGKAPPGR